MSDVTAETRPVNWLWLIVGSSAGVALLLAAIVLHLRTEVDEFWPALLVHLGTGVGLSGILFFLEQKYKNEHERTRAALRKISERLDERLDETLKQQDVTLREAAAAFHEDGSYESLRQMLVRATALGAISKLGVRTSVPTTPLYLRVCLIGDRDLTLKPIASAVAGAVGTIGCILEKSDRTEVAHLDWHPEDRTDDVFLALHDYLSQAGQPMGQEQFVSESRALRAAIAHTLTAAIDSGTGADRAPHPLSRIFQRITDDWFVTVGRLERLSDRHQITIEELRNGRVPQVDVGPNETETWPSIVQAARDAWRPNEWAEPFW